MINLSGLLGWAPTSGGRHTVPMDDLRIPPGPGCPRGLRVPAAELIERFSHASGPGGQGVNTSDSRVQLGLDLATTTALDEHQRERALAHLGERLTGTVLTVAAAEHRSQRRNRAAARERLAALCARHWSRRGLDARRSRLADPGGAAWRPREGARRSRRSGAVRILTEPPA